MKQIKIKQIISLAIAGLLVVACASIGSPDGGPYDETPPLFLGSTPEHFALNVKDKRVSLEFDEFIKIEKAAEKVVISPPQIQHPEIKTNGKKVVVQLYDTLKASTTYSINFSDAIVDYNEGNPLGNFSFLFSTGDQIDTLAVSGTVLNASNLEPIKGILVGLHSDLTDSAFTMKPFDRVSRTDADGRFTIGGIAPGSYRAYALQDANQNFIFDQKNEMIAFLDSLVVPYTEIRMHQDTTWIDSLTIDTIRPVPHVHYLPDDLVLLAFTEAPTQRYLIKTERPSLTHFSIYFSLGADSLPLLTPLNFPEDAYIVQTSVDHDSITYWMKDSLVYYQDTLSFALTYEYTDTAGLLVPRTDTLDLVPKKTRAKILQEEQKKREEAQKEREKRMKRGDTIPEAKPQPKFLGIKIKGSTSMDLNSNVLVDFNEPIVRYDEEAIHLYKKVDTSWVKEPHVFRQRKHELMGFELLGEWRPEVEYKVTIDSAAFEGLYGLHTKQQEVMLKFKSLSHYSTLYLTLQDAQPNYVVQLLGGGEKVVRQQRQVKGQADFYFLNPGTYHIRVFNDRNGNGVWDTGLYESKEKPEEVYYFPSKLEMRENWDYTQEWNPTALPVERQKPDEIKKQKSVTKERKSKNAEREEQKKRQQQQ